MADNGIRYISYCNVHGLVHISYDAIFVDDWDGADSSFGKHVYHVEYGSLHRCSCNRPVGVIGSWLNVRADTQRTEAPVQVIDFFALSAYQQAKRQ
jgi:hypothetical protein